MSRVQQCGIVNHNLMVVRKLSAYTTIRTNRDNNPGSALLESGGEPMTTDKPREEWKIEKGIVKECIVKDCKDKANIEGYCWKHYDENKGDNL